MPPPVGSTLIRETQCNKPSPQRIPRTPQKCVPYSRHKFHNENTQTGEEGTTTSAKAVHSIQGDLQARSRTQHPSLSVIILFVYFHGTGARFAPHQERARTDAKLRLQYNLRRVERGNEPSRAQHGLFGHDSHVPLQVRPSAFEVCGVTPFLECWGWLPGRDCFQPRAWSPSSLTLARTNCPQHCAQYPMDQH